MANRIAQRVSRVLSNPAFLESATLLRPGAGHRNQHGEWVPGADTTTTVQLATWPVTGQERMALPEGLRSDDIRTFCLRETVHPVEEGTDGTAGDRIRYGGTDWRIFQVEAWGGFTKAMGTRI